MKIIESENYREEYFREILASIFAENGVLSGMKLREGEVSGQVYVDIEPGSFCRDGVIYEITEKIFGMDPNHSHQLNITSITDSMADLNYRVSTRALTGFPRMFLVEYNTDARDLSKDPLFKITSSPQENEIIIGFRYVRNRVRLESDPKRFNPENIIGNVSDVNFSEKVSKS